MPLDLDAEAAKGYQNFLQQMRGWKIVLLSLAGTVLLVGGVGVLSVMLISFSDRRFEIGLRKALGASDQEIFIQFLLEALVLAAVPAPGAATLAAVPANLSPAQRLEVERLVSQRVDEELRWLRANLPELIATAIAGPPVPEPAQAEEATAAPAPPRNGGPTKTVADDVQMD